jgi:starch phosphorylase
LVQPSTSSPPQQRNQPHSRSLPTTTTPITVINPGSQQTESDGLWGFSGTVVLERAGSFGYTVRVVPKHENLASSAELGLVAGAH